jgi:hypothetical protein
MTATADLINSLSLDQYATQAFSLDANSPTGFGQGGVFAGPIAKGPEAKPWHAQYASPDNATISARARLVSIGPGKVFVRWAASRTRGDWKMAASGIWWVSDAMADFIVEKTVKLSGREGDTAAVARQYAQVDTGWGSDMGTVVVCRTTKPIKALIGVGRPVAGVPAVAAGISNELQVVILTTIASPKVPMDPKTPRRRTFIADQFMHNLWFGSSSAFTDWWLRSAIVNRRRVAQRIAMTGK